MYKFTNGVVCYDEEKIYFVDSIFLTKAKYFP